VSEHDQFRPPMGMTEPSEPIFFSAMDKPGKMVNAFTKDLTSIGLYNPPDSGVLLSLMQINGYMASIGSGEQTDFLMTSVLSPSDKAENIVFLPIYSAILNRFPSSKATAIGQATLPTETTAIMALDHFAGSSAMNETPEVRHVKLHGLVVLPPNSLVTIQGKGVQHLSWWSIFWREIPFIQTLLPQTQG